MSPFSRLPERSALTSYNYEPETWETGPTHQTPHVVLTYSLNQPACIPKVYYHGDRGLFPWRMRGTNTTAVPLLLTQMSTRFTAHLVRSQRLAST